jgi:hypothetical protein
MPGTQLERATITSANVVKDPSRSTKRECEHYAKLVLTDKKTRDRSEQRKYLPGRQRRSPSVTERPVPSIHGVSPRGLELVLLTETAKPGKFAGMTAEAHDLIKLRGLSAPKMTIKGHFGRAPLWAFAGARLIKNLPHRFAVPARTLAGVPPVARAVAPVTSPL